MKKFLKKITFIAVMAAIIAVACKNDTDPTPTPQPPTISSVTSSPASLTLPGVTTSVTLACVATSADGSAVKSTVWSVKEKPAAATVTISGNTASGLTATGVYKFEALVTGSNDKTATSEVTVKANLNATVNFVTLAASYSATTIDFSPSNLPAGVTYKLTDDKGNPAKDSAQGFDGKVASSSYSTGAVTFTQTFYLNGTEITGANSKRIVHMTASPVGFLENPGDGGDSGSVTLVRNL